jgi:hypothetical protein
VVKPRSSLLTIHVSADVLPLYIESQNAVVIFRKIRHDCLTFEHFEAQIPTEIVMKKANKIQMTFPSNPRLLVASKPDVLSNLANVLSYFSANEIDDALPKTRKGGSEHHETRDVPSPRYISEAIAGILRATQPTDGPPFETTFVTKRLDDHVLWKSTLKPWRRSPIWLLIRVSLQTTLSGWGVADRVGYKAFQAFFMATILKDAVFADPQSFTIDLLYFMNAKLARRLTKMGKCTEDDANKALKISRKIVEEISTILNRRWGQVTTEWEERKQWTPPDPTAFEGCLNLRLANSQEYLQKVVNRSQELNQTVQGFDEAATERQLRSACTARAAYTSSYSLPTSILRVELEVSLFDFESWVKNHLQPWVKSSSRSGNDCLPLSNIIDEYREAALAHYKDNPERLSLMHLCILELWVALDTLVGKWCPLFLDYSPEIPINFLDPLLLPYFEQLGRLHQVQAYLRQRHQKAAIRSNYSLLKDFEAPHSFANRFFDLPMANSLKQLKGRIQTWANTQRSNKISELHTLNEQFQSLQREADKQDCDRLAEPQITRKQHKKQCNKCKLKRAAGNLSIIPMEEPLPENPVRSNAIVFELQCPVPIAVWRDAVKKILQINEVEGKSSPDVYLVSNYEPLNQFFHTSYPGQRISIASSSKSISKSHYGNKQKIPATEAQVIHRSSGSFSLCEFRYQQWLTVGEAPNLRLQCTLRLEDLYKPLQGYLNSTLHTSNEVIAAQNQCPADISIDEYLAFGQLRSGNRLQWRNIMRAIRAQTLTFSECGVYLLILQSVWQVGPMGDEGLCREAHSDLMDDQFCQEVLEELRMTLQMIKNNWTQYVFLACMVTLALRIHSFAQSEELRDFASTILAKARYLAFQWITTLRKSPLERNERNNHWKRALIGASLVLRATFDVEDREGFSVFKTNQDLVWYLYTGTLISGQNIESFPSSIRLLACRDRRTSWRLQSHVSNACTTHSMTLNLVLSLKWSHHNSKSDWLPLKSPADRWWSCITEQEIGGAQQMVHMNIVDGSILINGKAFDRLPANYMSHPLYRSLFNSEVNLFSVIPLALILEFIQELEDVCCSTLKGMDYEGYYRNHEV